MPIDELFGLGGKRNINRFVTKLRAKIRNAQKNPIKRLASANSGPKFREWQYYCIICVCFGYICMIVSLIDRKLIYEEGNLIKANHIGVLMPLHYLGPV